MKQTIFLRTKQQQQAAINAILENLKKTSEEIDARVSNLKEQGLTIKENRKLIEFQNDINNTLKGSSHWEDGKSMDWQQSIIARYYGGLARDIETWSKEERQALFDKEILNRHNDHLNCKAHGQTKYNGL